MSKIEEFIPVDKPTKPPEQLALLRDMVRSLRLIAIFAAIIVANAAAWVFGGYGDDAMAWFRRVAIFAAVMFISGWVALTRKRIV